MRDDPSLWLELTPSCNLSCAFCYNPWRSGGKVAHPQTISYDLLCDAVARLVERTRFRYVALSGGEPLLYRRLPELTAWLAARGQRTILTTNGRLLTEARLAALTAAGLDGVQVSLLGSRARTHDTLAGRASWLQALGALARSRAAGLSTAATFIVTSGNVSELPETVALLARLDVRQLVVNELQPVGSAGEQLDALEIAPERFETALEAASAAAREHGVTLIPIRAASAEAGLEAGWRRWSIAPDGALKLCNHSTRTLGSLPELPDEALDALADALERGRYERLAEHVDGCLCFERALARQRAAAA